MGYFDNNNSNNYALRMTNQQLSVEDQQLMNTIQGKLNFYYQNNIVPIEYWVDLDFNKIPGIDMLSYNEARYMISDFGRLFDKKNLTFQNPYVDFYGYVTVRIRFQNIKKEKIMKVHRLVMIGFNYIPDYNNWDVNHIDGVKTDNYVENLEWCDDSHNIQHAFETGLNHRGEEHYKTWIDESDAKYVCDMLQNGASYADITQGLKDRGIKYDGVADEHKAYYDLIYYIHHGRTWKHISRNYNLEVEPVKEYLKFTDEDVHRICQIYASGKFKNVPDIMRQAGFNVDTDDIMIRNRLIQFCYNIIYKRRRTNISDLYFPKGFKPIKKKE